MKPIKFLLTASAAALCLASCSSEENLTKSGDAKSARAAAESQLSQFQDAARQKLQQVFTFDAKRERVTLVSKRGVKINIEPKRLTVKGQPVQGSVTVIYSEVFDRGTMLTTNMTTMGIAEQNGEEPLIAPLISGGEFFINMVTEEGQNVDQGSPYEVVVPTELTGGQENSDGMIVWDGNENSEGDVIWDKDTEEDGTESEVPVEEGEYIMSLNEFGWINIDRLAEFPNPPTTMYVDVPDGFDDTNTKIYLAFQGQQSMLTRLNTYDAATELFGEDYNVLPQGMQCNVIFVSTQGGQWLYGIKTINIPFANPATPITFASSDLSVVTQSSLISVLNSLP